ncbi:MAG: tyrosine-type recombinase/integrase, partial [Methyloligellaceae bacterium]
MKLIDEYGDYLVGVRNVRPATVKNYSLSLRRIFYWIGKHPREITLEDVKRYFIQAKLDEMTINAQRSRQGALRMFFRWYAPKAGIADPTAELVVIREEIKYPDVLAPEDLVRMVAACDPTTEIGRRNAALLCLLADTGIRAGEAALLRVGNVVPEGGNFVLVVPRYKSHERRVPFAKLTEHSLIGETFLRYWAEIRYQKRWGQEHPLFERCSWNENLRGGPLNRIGIHYLVQRCANRARLEKHVTCHSFRHFFGTYAVLNGARLEEVQALMGHVSIQTTMRYVHVAAVISGKTASVATTGLSIPREESGWVDIWRKARKAITKP